MKNLADRLLLFNQNVIDDSLELDYLDSISIDFSTFPTEERVYEVAQYDILRLDYVSFKFYNTPYYWWLIAKRNDIIDVSTELFVGQRLYIPALADYFDFYNKNIKPRNKTDRTFSKRTLE